MPGKTAAVDIETYPNFFFIGIKRFEDNKRVGFELSERTEFEIDREKIRYFFRHNRIITFNGLTFDIPLIFLMLQGVPVHLIKEAANTIIEGRLKYWEVPQRLGVEIPPLNHIDLMEPNPAVRASLKTLNGRIHGQRLQDLPYEHNTVLTHEQMDVVADYCLHSDLDATHNLFNAIREPIELREAMGKVYGADFRSKSDAQMGERIIKSQVEKKLNKKVEKAVLQKGHHFKYQVPSWMKFQTPELKRALEIVRETNLVIDEKGKVEFPEAFENIKIEIGSTKYKLGIGGLHSQESCRVLRSDDDWVLVDADVASQYPAIIMKLGLYPAALGPEFLPVYKTLMDQRLKAKREGDKITDKGLKISINGAYGKLGSPYSVLYAPHLMIAVTLTGQLSLLMLIEAAELAGIPVASGNTDGVLFRCPRSYFGGIKGDSLLPGKLKEVTDWWQQLTSFQLEFATYRAIYNRDVNYYVAIKQDGKAKRKGSIANHWCPKSPDYDPVRSQLMKNPKMTVCGDAVLAFLRDGKSIEEFIRSYDDIRGFVTVINATGGATWRDEYLGKVVRYYWSTDGDPMIKVKGHPKTGKKPKVPETDGCRPIMNLPDHLPTDIDYDRYIKTSWDILWSLGWRQVMNYSPIYRTLRR
jgi:hypothetical protein